MVAELEDPAERLVELDDRLDELDEIAFLPYSIINEPAPQYSALLPLHAILHLLSRVTVEEAAIVLPQ